MMFAHGRRPTFVGREAERALLSDALTDAVAGRGRFIMVTGSPGIGKTSLTDIAVEIAEARGVTVAIARAWPGAGAPPWWIWTEVLRALDESLTLPRTLASEEARFACLEEIVQRIRVRGAKAPLLIVLDDLHDVDASSLLALTLVARTIGRLGVLVVATLPDPDPSTPESAVLIATLRREATIVRLEGLGLTDVEQLAAARGIRGDAAAVTLRLTGGNPLFACELLDDKDAREALAAGHEPPAGHGVRGVLRRHLERLAPEVRTSLEWAAISGDPIDVALVAAVTARPTTEVAAHIEAARESGVIGAHGFAHALFRAAACADIPGETRAAMHLAIAEHLALRPNTARQVAMHLREADATAPATARAMCAAAREAMAALAYEEAVRLAESATELDARHGRTAAQADALCLLAEARAHAGDLTGSAEAAQRSIVLAREVGDRRMLARAALALGLRRVMAVSNAPLVLQLDEALAGLDGDDDIDLRCAVEARLAAALQPRADPRRALDLARGAIARARAAGDRMLLARTLHAARPAFRLLEPFEERLAIDREALMLADAHGDDNVAAHAQGRLFWDALEMGDRLSAEVALAAYERLATKLSLAHHRIGAASARVACAVIAGRWPDAIAILDELERTRDTWANATLLSHSLDPVLAMRTMGTLSRPLIDAIAAVTPPPIRPLLVTSLLARAGLHDDARVGYDAVASRCMADAEPPMITRTLLGDTTVRLRVPTHAAQLHALLVPFSGLHAVCVPLPFYLGSIDRILAGLLAILGDRTAAATRYDAAIEQEEALGARTFAAQTRSERDALLGAIPRPVATTPRRPELAHEGDTWLLRFGSEHARLKDSDGLRYLAYLLARPDVPIPVIELFAVRSGAPDSPPRPGDAGFVLDRDAITAYRARARDLAAQLETGDGDDEHARRELAFLEDELRGALGLGGRSRRAASDVERIRVNVTTRIKKTIARMRERAPALAHHLSTTIRTGTVCTYRCPP